MTASAGPRYLVAYRLGGRGSREEHAGSFRTVREALVRQEYIRLELAAGRDPKTGLMRAEDIRSRQAVGRNDRVYGTVEEVGWRWLDTRIDLSTSSVKLYEAALARVSWLIGHLDVREVRRDDLQTAIGKLMEAGLSPRTIRLYVKVVLGQVFDFAGVDPNPVRSKHVRFPRIERPIPRVPTRDHIIAVLDLIASEYRLPLLVLEQTGLRLGEVFALTWEDVDEPDSRLRVESGKTAAARRWAQAPPWVVNRIGFLVAVEDRVPERCVFHGITAAGLDGALRRACFDAGVPVFSAHDLRHRYASVMAKRGVPRTDLAAQLGHSRVSMLDQYEHVIVDDFETGERLSATR